MAVPSPPILTPPPGGNQNIGWRFLVVQTVLSIIPFALVCARVYVRGVVLKCLGIDDGLLVIGTVREVPPHANKCPC